MGAEWRGYRIQYKHLMDAVCRGVNRVAKQYVSKCCLPQNRNAQNKKSKHCKIS